jgi:hypothetical protein
MKLLRTILNRAPRGASRFDRYYGEVIRPGVGYPTADEARRDMIRNNQRLTGFGWNR